MKSFHFSRTPILHFGSGSLDVLDSVLRAGNYRRVAVFTGSSSLRSGERWASLKERLSVEGRSFAVFTVRGEPSPAFVDEAVEDLRERRPDVVIAAGGGSVMDAGKAVSAMLGEEGSVRDFLEGVGKRKPTGRKVPFIAVPTTAGTGSEATKNAVLSSPGPDGFKKSLRHEGYIPDVAIVDPQLALGCPPEVTAASGLDAVTQLIESLVSSGATPLSDALAVDGLEHAAWGLPRAVRDGASDIEARSAMAYAAYLSGVALANAGLGVVHAVASPIGGYFPVPHGVVCGTLIGEATRLLIARCSSSGSPGEGERLTLSKYARAGKALTGEDAGSDEKNCERLVTRLDEWIEGFQIPRLASYGIREADLRRVADEARLKSSPVALTSDEIYEMLCSRR